MPTTLVEDFTDVLAELATGTYEIHPGVGLVHDGAGGYSPGAAAAPVTGVVCSVQPLKGDEVLPESGGGRLQAWRKVFTAYPLQPEDTATGRGGDVILIDSPSNGPGVEPYVVHTVNAWGLAAGVTEALVYRQRR